MPLSEPANCEPASSEPASSEPANSEAAKVLGIRDICPFRCSEEFPPPAKALPGTVPVCQPAKESSCGTAAASTGSNADKTVGPAAAKLVCNGSCEMVFAAGIAARTTAVATFELEGICVVGALLCAFFIAALPAADILPLKFVAGFPVSGRLALSPSSRLGGFSVSSDAFAAASVDANPPSVRELTLPQPLAATTGSATTLLGMVSMVAITNSPGTGARLAWFNATR
jgi:hypothetical protein